MSKCFIKKRILTFSSLNHLPWQSRFQPASVNFSSLSRRSLKSKCCCTSIFSDAITSGHELFSQILATTFIIFTYPTLNFRSQFWFLELNWAVPLPSISVAAFFVFSINGLLTNLVFLFKALGLAGLTSDSDNANLLLISLCLINSFSFRLDSAAICRDPLQCIYKIKHIWTICWN